MDLTCDFACSICTVETVRWIYRRAHLAQLVERKTFNLVAEGSSPSVGRSTFLEKKPEARSFVLFAMLICL